MGSNSSNTAGGTGEEEVSGQKQCFITDTSQKQPFQQNTAESRNNMTRNSRQRLYGPFILIKKDSRVICAGRNYILEIPTFSFFICLLTQGEAVLHYTQQYMKSVLFPSAFSCLQRSLKVRVVSVGQGSGLALIDLCLNGAIESRIPEPVEVNREIKFSGFIEGTRSF